MSDGSPMKSHFAGIQFLWRWIVARAVEIRDSSARNVNGRFEKIVGTVHWKNSHSNLMETTFERYKRCFFEYLIPLFASLNCEMKVRD
jgi:hypothetical protein